MSSVTTPLHEGLDFQKETQSYTPQLFHFSSITQGQLDHELKQIYNSGVKVIEEMCRLVLHELKFSRRND
jgi:hypothetical protein